ncbi:hypothetical protein LXL04_024174 [Taraxacum kok-saghyz]
MAGPVQYYWMYQFEKIASYFKMYVHSFVVVTIGRVEGSIVNAYLLREAAIFCSYYFETGVHTPKRNLPHNNDGGDDRHDDDNETLTVFSFHGRHYWKLETRMLCDEELMQPIRTYSFMKKRSNLTSVYLVILFSMYEEMLKALMELTEYELVSEVEQNFIKWLENYVRTNKINNMYIHDISRRPLRKVKSCNVYFVNETHAKNKEIMNSGVCISSEGGDYYGKKTTFLLLCHLYDLTPRIGVKVHKQYNLVEIYDKRKYSKFESFCVTCLCLDIFKFKLRGWTNEEKVIIIMTLLFNKMKLYKMKSLYQQ